MPSIPGTLLCTLIALLHLVESSSILAKRDADFYDVRTKQEVSHNREEPDKPEKYFHECTFHEHCDGRFADKTLAYDQKQIHLRALVQTYLATMNDLGIETFLMHGTLLGWWWNRKIMPWDSDVDVMVSEKSIHHLAAYYNMTVYHLRVADSDSKRDYLLEINPHYSNSTVEPDNKIDARWIDTDSGLFIDITTLRRNTTTEALGSDGAMMVKDKHHYQYDDIFPLRDSEFEGSPAKVPFAYSDILIEEYGDLALTDVYFQEHRFDASVQEWVPLRWVDPLHRPQVGTTYWGRVARQVFARGR